MSAPGTWLILRTSGAKTLALAKSLAGAGFDVWTPSYVKQAPKHDGRMPATVKTTERECAIAPTFVFARATHLADLMIARALPTNQHPAFSIFHYAGRIPLIGDGEVQGFRDEEERNRPKVPKVPKERHRKLVTGQRVHMSDGAYAGLTGIVETAQGGWAMVAFAGGVSMKVDSWLLSPDLVRNEPSPLGAAA